MFDVAAVLLGVVDDVLDAVSGVDFGQRKGPALRAEPFVSVDGCGCG
jgi:hypothetical protein